MKKLIPYGAIRSKIKLLWLYSDQRKECLKLAKQCRGKYRCNICNKLFPPSEINVDHIIPISTFTNWDSWIIALFCDANNLQCLCLICHKDKTNQETKDRKKK